MILSRDYMTPFWLQRFQKPFLFFFKDGFSKNINTLMRNKNQNDEKVINIIF